MQKIGSGSNIISELNFNWMKKEDSKIVLETHVYLHFLKE